MISCGTRDRRVLVYINNLNKEYINKRRLSIVLGIPRSSVYDIIQRLEHRGLIKRDETRNTIITEIGKSYLGVSVGGVDNLRRECRKSENLSIHYQRYKMKITDRTNFSEHLLINLNPNYHKVIHLPNLLQHYVYFDDATIIINPKVVIIRIHDIISSETELGHFKSLQKALEYVNKLRSIGVVGERILLENAHYARVKSVLSDTLEKIDNRYFLDLGKGQKFWIDHSGDKREDETNSMQYRERLDNFLLDLNSSDSNMIDVDKMKEVLGLLIKLETIRMIPNYHKQEIPKEKADYFG